MQSGASPQTGVRRRNDSRSWDDCASLPALVLGFDTRTDAAPKARKTAVNGHKIGKLRKKVKKAHFRAGQVTGSGI